MLLGFANGRMHETLSLNRCVEFRNPKQESKAAVEVKDEGARCNRGRNKIEFSCRPEVKMH